MKGHGRINEGWKKMEKKKNKQIENLLKNAIE